jgi:hypothetical protein
MQSPQVLNVVGSTTATSFESPKAVRGGYSELQVLSSSAGYYIGTRYEEFDEGGNCVWVEPGSRDSGYFRTEEQAADSLKGLIDGTQEVELRMTP